MELFDARVMDSTHLVLFRPMTAGRERKVLITVSMVSDNDEERRQWGAFRLNPYRQRMLIPSLITQLRWSKKAMRNTGHEGGGYAYDLDMVHQRLTHSMLNGIKLARSGYK